MMLQKCFRLTRLILENKKCFLVCVNACKYMFLCREREGKKNSYQCVADVIKVAKESELYFQ